MLAADDKVYETYIWMRVPRQYIGGKLYRILVRVIAWLEERW